MPTGTLLHTEHLQVSWGHYCSAGRRVQANAVLHRNRRRAEGSAGAHRGLGRGLPHPPNCPAVSIDGLRACTCLPARRALRCGASSSAHSSSSACCAPSATRWRRSSRQAARCERWQRGQSWALCGFHFSTPCVHAAASCQVQDQCRGGSPYGDAPFSLQHMHFQAEFGLRVELLPSPLFPGPACTTATAQVAVPILLVVVALWVRQLSAAYPQQPALALNRCAVPLLC